ncbi:tRNA (cytosine(34)-C(5))-methyltransferase [Anopheles ziemanni]|uniref:tRNA (cytosine(34)-C(5))-methyltransferase n=1 Tax=Anopheles coustani TaxID=139045 RepID=UPI00265AA2BE|nr:tRNA (cytosine(34)-C(5))-methyltransferase [Anopheles coustani]XP_058171375.1 tRNA (cytosine(34)-C(5))-methyltransferase [Anopheles ziemanni]
MGKPKHLTNKQNPFAKKKRHNKEKADEPPARREKPYESIVLKNESFEAYYKHQQICSSEEEWDQFIEHMRKNLPVTFRITGSKAQANLLLKLIKRDFFDEYFRAVKELRKEEEGAHVEPPQCLGWYPGEMAWQLELSRKDIRRSEPLFKLHNFLISETSSGNISRQEAVSMIPPLVLDVQPHHKVLDMCAAPGSKTAQLIESLHAGEGTGIPPGFVMANDVDNNRCYMLVHQAKRLNSPCFMVTNTDSATFPSMQITKDGVVSPLKFDRVLCDVPCSGDGTLRKNADIWTKWNLGQATNLHGLQYRILKRGAELLEVGGKLVYSTCSLNPIENEAVLHHLLKQTDDSLEIVECGHMLPTLKYSKGMTYWEPATHKELKYYKSFDEVPENQRTVLRPDMFPPAKEESVEKFHLDRCLRILPNQQNTGGFFVALIEKKKPLPWESTDTKEDNGQDLAKGSEAPEPPTKKAKYMRGFKEDPFVFFDDNEDVFESINEFYKLSEGFNPRNLLTRCKVGKKKNIYFCSSVVRDLVQLNEKRVKFINLGVKSFVRCVTRNIKCEFRLAQEGLANVNAFIGERRRVKVQPSDLIELLSCTDPTKPPEIAALTAETQENLKNFDSGSCILQCELDELNLAVVGWKGAVSLRAYVDQYDTVHLLRLLGGDLSKFEKNKFQDKLRAEQEGEQKDDDGDEDIVENESPSPGEGEVAPTEETA